MSHAELKRRCHEPIWPLVSIRSLFAILIAAAMLFAPLATQDGSAMAMAPAAQAQVIEKGHCQEQPAKGSDHNPASKSCCVAMCASLAIALAAPVQPFAYARSADQPAIEQFGRSFLAELPTPPPRRA